MYKIFMTFTHNMHLGADLFEVLFNLNFCAAWFEKFNQ